MITFKEYMLIESPMAGVGRKEPSKGLDATARSRVMKNYPARSKSVLPKHAKPGGRRGRNVKTNVGVRG